MRFGVAVVLVASVAALLVSWNLPVVLHFYDLVLPKPGLYEPVLQTPFDLWSSTSSLIWPFDCRWGRRIYQISVSVPVTQPESWRRDTALWPDLGGSYRLTIVRDGRTVLTQDFTGRATSVRRDLQAGESRELYSLSDFSLARCAGSIVRVDVLEPATAASSLRESAQLIVRVSPEI